MLEFIVKADANQMSNTLRDCLTISLRTDGSMDQMQIHKNNLQANVVHPDGSDSLYFHAFGESDDRGAKCYLAAIKKSC